MGGKENSPFCKGRKLIMPIIKISDTERIISTERNWEYQKLRIRHDKGGLEEWTFYRNYISIESALLDLYNTRIRLSEHESLIDAVDDAKSLISKLIHDNTHLNIMLGDW
jgi:hypothetical protein